MLPIIEREKSVLKALEMYHRYRLGLHLNLHRRGAKTQRKRKEGKEVRRMSDSKRAGKSAMFRPPMFALGRWRRPTGRSVLAYS